MHTDIPFLRFLYIILKRTLYPTREKFHAAWDKENFFFNSKAR